MALTSPGRWTAELDGDFVVFLIGFRARVSPRALRAVPLLMQMPRMLQELQRDPSKGLLSYQQFGGPFGSMVQYWRSFEALERFARDPDCRHAQTWREWFRRAQHLNPAVGIWHETYRVSAGAYEAVYQNVPAGFGLMGAGTAAPLRPGVRAAARMGVEESDLPVPAQA